MSNRRNFVKQAALSAAGLLVTKSSLASSTPHTEEDKTYNTTVDQPIVISTWDFGREANTAAWQILKNRGAALDAVEAGVKIPEADPTNQTVGLGGRPDRDGRVTLDACIMDHNYRCGAVAGMEHIIHAISVARQVMEKTPHIMLVGDGALQFALANGFKKANLLTPQSESEWREWLKKEKYNPIKNIENLPGGTRNHDTIGMLAMDTIGNLSGACTTSGMAYKLHGRVGDSPIIGAGLYVDNEVGAATSSGLGEEVIRVVGSHLVVEYMRRGQSPAAACRKAVERIVRHKGAQAKELQVGFLALNKHGEHGAFAIQDGFTYALRTNQKEEIIKSPFLL